MGHPQANRRALGGLGIISPRSKAPSPLSSFRVARYYLARLQGISEVLQHQVVQVVGEELSLGPLHLVDGFLGPLALREVAGHLGELRVALLN